MKTFSADWWLYYFGVSISLKKGSKTNTLISKHTKRGKMKSQAEMLTDIMDRAKKDGLKAMGSSTNLYISNGVDIDWDAEIRIHHIKECATAYIDKRTAHQIIDHLKKLYSL
jgi:hypothetical protein